MPIKYYILDADHHVVEAELLEWGRWFERIENRLVDWTQINEDVHVSTVFIGIDHRFFGEGPPIVFESMIFGGPLNYHQQRYSSWDDAETGHKVMVRRAREAIRLPASTSAPDR